MPFRRRDAPSAVLLAMGFSPDVAFGAVRLSLGRINTRDDITHAAQALTSSYRQLRLPAASNAALTSAPARPGPHQCEPALRAVGAELSGALTDDRPEFIGVPTRRGHRRRRRPGLERLATLGRFLAGRIGGGLCGSGMLGWSGEGEHAAGGQGDGDRDEQHGECAPQRLWCGAGGKPAAAEGGEHGGGGEREDHTPVDGY